MHTSASKPRGEDIVVVLDEIGETGLPAGVP
jgi:hypothetical protein